MMTAEQAREVLGKYIVDTSRIELIKQTMNAFDLAIKEGFSPEVALMDTIYGLGRDECRLDIIDQLQNGVG
jgi:hypothetical protein